MISARPRTLFPKSIQNNGPAPLSLQPPLPPQKNASVENTQGGYNGRCRRVSSSLKPGTRCGWRQGGKSEGGNRRLTHLETGIWGSKWRGLIRGTLKGAGVRGDRRSAASLRGPCRSWLLCSNLSPGGACRTGADFEEGTSGKQGGQGPAPRAFPQPPPPLTPSHRCSVGSPALVPEVRREQGWRGDGSARRGWRDQGRAHPRKLRLARSLPESPHAAEAKQSLYSSSQKHPVSLRRAILHCMVPWPMALWCPSIGVGWGVRLP